MKFVKGIGLFFLYPLTMLVIGFYVGVEVTQNFYPGHNRLFWRNEQTVEPGGDAAGENVEQNPAALGSDSTQTAEGISELAEDTTDQGEEAQYVSSASETLYVGTKYVLEETDVLRHTVVETTWSLPNKYVGMNREQFLTAMETYAAAPPLKELERGFVGLEVLSFARERVVVRMNYRYVQPSTSFYLAAYDSKVRVYLEDQSTVYIDTEIALNSLPLELQQEIIQMMWIENEEALYSFLETYSS